MEHPMIFVRIATLNDRKYADEIVQEMEASAILRGSGIARRTAASIAEKMSADKAVVAVTASGEWVGFAYLEVWEDGAFVSNSGLIVAPKFRNLGVAKAIKERIFKLSRRLYPNAKIFSITSGTAIMKMNSRLGFEPVGFAEITQDDQFWAGCKSCVNYDILQQKKKCNCLCTAMLFDPRQELVCSPQVAAVSGTEFNTVTLDCVSSSKMSLVPGAMGTSALCAALQDIQWFTDYVFPIERNLPNPVKMTITEMSRDIKEMKPAGTCGFTVQIKYDHSYTLYEIITTIKNHTLCKFTIRNDSAKLMGSAEPAYKSQLVSNNY